MYFFVSQQKELVNPIPTEWFYFSVSFGSTEAGIEANKVQLQFQQSGYSGSVELRGLALHVCIESKSLEIIFVCYLNIHEV